MLIILFAGMSLNYVCAADETGIGNTTLAVIDDISPQVDEVHEAYADTNLTSQGGNTFEITQISYEKYFNPRSGEILADSGISGGDTLKIGNISNRAFVIDRQLTIMPITQNDVITNCFIHLVKGSDGSTVTNLTINNTKSTLTFRGVAVGQLHGIWLTNSNNNLISYNTIRIANAAGVYAMPMGWSSNNRIVYNDMKTYITSVIIMGQCHYNLISHNALEVLSYSDMSVTNLIYFNPFNHADYSGSPLCLGNVISYNYLKGFCTLPMSIILQLTYANHDGTVVANNTIIKGSFGVNLLGNNVSVYGNVIDNSATGIAVGGSSIDVNSNSVSGDSQKSGISISGSPNSTCVVYGNNITFTDVSYAMAVSDNVEAYDNVINVKGYGVGISISGNGSCVHDNRIKNNRDDAVSILGSLNRVDNNIITTNCNGVSIPAKGNGVRYYNNTISRNRIISNSYGVYITGLVYNTGILDNIIETNRSIGIYKDITDESSNKEEDNMVNGIILKSTAVVINDTNYFDYFDANGYLTYEFPENKTKVLILTFLTNKKIVLNDKINVISNKMSNLLFNVTIVLKSNASGSLIRDFNFANNNRNAIIIDGAYDVSITKNNFNAVFNRGSGDNSVILIRDVCENSLISNNNIFINSRLDNVYAFNANNRKPSKGFSVINNTIIIVSSGDCEAISSNSLFGSEFNFNNINIICEGTAYGINLNGELSDVDVFSNEIIINSNERAYMINILNLDNVGIFKNNLYGQGNEVYGILVNASQNVSIADNGLSIFTGHGGNAIAIDSSDCLLVNSNLIYSDASVPISFDVNVTSNTYVIGNDNYDVYFDDEGNLKSGLIGSDATLLLHNLTSGQKLNINTQVKISSYCNNQLSVVLSLDENASKSEIYSIKFNNSTLILNNSSNVVIRDICLFDSSVYIEGGNGNCFRDNAISGSSRIILNNTSSNKISNNNFNVSSVDNVISCENASYTLINNNVMNACSKALVFIYCTNSAYDNVTGNVLNGSANSIYGYVSINSQYGEITKNDIFIEGGGIRQAGVLLINSSNTGVFSNRIISHSVNGGEYAVEVMSDSSMSNQVLNNYLISSNGLKYADASVYAPFDVVDLNTPRDIFVSADEGDDDGDGSEGNPYATISRAIEKALNYSVIYVYGGNYSISNTEIDKNLTIVSLNPGKVVIDACGNQLFTISNVSTLSISGMIIKNAHNVDGGSVFINNGKLFISNLVIFNSSSYYDNSNPVFNENQTFSSDGDLKEAYTIDCRNTGLGGAILNKGELTINSSVFFNNLGHYGGVIADFGKTTIESSLFYDNLGVHGGVIYTHTPNRIEIKNSTFTNNVALVSIDFCRLRLYTTAWSIDEGNIHQVGSACGADLGYGGVIYANNDMLIENCEFNSNSARFGGAIATYASNPLPNLEIKNSTFINNRANDTRRSLGSNDLNYFSFTSGHDGGAVWGNYNKLYVSDSEFYYNQAINDGGALNVRAKDGKITDSVFAGNIAGIGGGALDISDNFLIMRTIISNNSASYGGAIEYGSSVYYGHIQYNLNIYNSTISNNKALDKGGAFNFGTGNISIHDSNIVNNFAPAGNTIHTSGTTNVIDMRYNYWGKTSKGFLGPDDSVWSVSNNQFKPWYGQWVNWEPSVADGDGPSSGNGGSGNSNNNPNPNDDNAGSGNSNNPTSTNTGSSASTGNVIGGRGNWIYTGSGDGSNLGYGGIGNNHGGSYSSLFGNSYNGQNIRGTASNSKSDSSHGSEVNGNVNYDSLSKTNSSSYDSKLASIGTVANAAAAASSSQGSSQGGESGGDSSASSSVSKSYEINEIEDSIKDENSMIKFLMVALMTLFLLVVGYKKNEEKEEY